MGRDMIDALLDLGHGRQDEVFIYCLAGVTIVCGVWVAVEMTIRIRQLLRKGEEES